MSYSFGAQAKYGEMGCKAVAAYFRSKGYAVEDLQGAREWQKRDIDLLVKGLTVEVKTDRYSSKAIFLEVTSHEKPGAVFKSRAEIWAYWFPGDGVLHWLALPALQWFMLKTDLSQYKHFEVDSHRGGRKWQAEGYVVPIADLKAAGVPVFSFKFTKERAEALIAAEAAGAGLTTAEGEDAHEDAQESATESATESEGEAA